MPELIDRGSLLEAMRNCEAVTHSVGYSDMIEIIEDAPEIKPKPRQHGLWIRTPLKGYYKCSACEYAHTSNPSQRYCSYCGADMRKEGAENADQ